MAVPEVVPGENWHLLFVEWIPKMNKLSDISI